MGDGGGWWGTKRCHQRSKFTYAVIRSSQSSLLKVVRLTNAYCTHLTPTDLLECRAIQFVLYLITTKSWSLKTSLIYIVDVLVGVVLGDTEKN